MTQVYRKKWVVEIERITREKVNGEQNPKRLASDSKQSHTSDACALALAEFLLAMQSHGNSKVLQAFADCCSNTFYNLPPQRATSLLSYPYGSWGTPDVWARAQAPPYLWALTPARSLSRS